MTSSGNGSGVAYQPLCSATLERSAMHSGRMLGNDEGVHCSTKIRWPSGALAAQVFPPFFVAGLGMVAAGLLLGKVHRWPVFEEVRELLIVVPPLLGLKGNLEMTLASRLSTHANLGHLDLNGVSGDTACSDVGPHCVQTSFGIIVIGNFMAVQCQAVVVGFLASLVALAMNFLAEGGAIDWDHALLLSSSTVAAASTASLLLALIMILVVIASRRCGIDPDNVASPIAGMLGDFCTLALLSCIAHHLWESKLDYWPVQCGLLVFYGGVAALCGSVTRRNSFTSGVLQESWVPVIVSMLISSGGGLILKKAVAEYHRLASFAPVMNGAGGNLAAVHTSRLSTGLHAKASLMPSPRSPTAPASPKSTEGTQYLHSDSPSKFLDGTSTLSHANSQSLLAPWPDVLGFSGPARAARVLTSLMVPGGLVFSSLVVGFDSGWEAAPKPAFLCIYTMAAVLQVLLLIVAAHSIVRILWKRGLNPDNAAIPYVTSLGDVMGTSLLAGAFVLMDTCGLEMWAGCNARCMS